MALVSELSHMQRYLKSSGRPYFSIRGSMTGNQRVLRFSRKMVLEWR